MSDVNFLKEKLLKQFVKEEIHITPEQYVELSEEKKAKYSYIDDVDPYYTKVLEVSPDEFDVFYKIKSLDIQYKSLQILQFFKTILIIIIVLYLIRLIFSTSYMLTLF
ncbi:MAG TPA: hypothetical protein PK581_01600 [Caldisericia bacterium]|nr:hypothetical protein [Caldisericia bacterium]